MYTRFRSAEFDWLVGVAGVGPEAAERYREVCAPVAFPEFVSHFRGLGLQEQVDFERILRAGFQPDSAEGRRRVEQAIAQLETEGFRDCPESDVTSWRGR